MMKKIIFFAVAVSGVIEAHAAGHLPPNYVVSTSLPGFAAAIQTAATGSAGSVLFPSAILKKSNIYMSAESTAHGTYTLYLNYTANCGVAAYCNLGHFDVKPSSGPLTIYRNSTGRVMTHAVTLANGQKAAYTEGYAMADYWPPHLDWIAQGKLYSLTYSNAKKQDLLWMANHLTVFSSSSGGNS